MRRARVPIGLALGAAILVAPAPVPGADGREMRLEAAGATASAPDDRDAPDGRGTMREAEDAPGGAPVPRRPGRIRPDVDLRFPEPVLPRGRLRSQRPDPDALAAYLGPVPKIVVAGEGTPLADLRRVDALPHTRVGFATRGGNTLHPEDVRRLARLSAVDLHLAMPLLEVHLEVFARLGTVASVTLRAPPGETVDGATLERLLRTGPGRRHLVLEGETRPARLSALAGLPGLSRVVLTIRLPDAGLDDGLREALGALGLAGIEVVVPTGGAPRAIATLSGLESLEAVVLETHGNRLREEVREASAALGVRNRVRLDRRAAREDLRHLKGLERLELLVWLGEETDIPAALTELLAESEGVRPRRETPPR